MQRTISKDVYIGKNLVVPIATVEQNDDIVLKLRVIHESDIIDTSTQFIELYALRPDGSVIKQLTGLSSGKEYLTVTLRSDILAIYGMVDIQLKFENTDGKVHTSRFRLRVNQIISSEVSAVALSDDELLEAEYIVLRNAKGDRYKIYVDTSGNLQTEKI